MNIKIIMLSGMAGLVCINILIVMGLLKRLGKSEKQIATIEAQLKLKTQELQAFCRGAVGLGERIGFIEGSLKKVVSQPKTTVATPILDGNHYKQARKLFELGASLEDVMFNCHLSKEEAELVALLSNTSTRSQTLTSPV